MCSKQTVPPYGNGSPGKVETPDGVTKEIWSIIDLQQHAANYVLTLVHRFQPDGEIRICVSDNEYMSQIQG